ncbi:MAG: hypothetical protein WBD56_11170 [Anaerolineales bacterium]
MIKFLLFLVLWFVAGVGLAMIWDTDSLFFVGLYSGWFWLGMTGLLIYNVKIATVMMRKFDY